MKRERLDKTMSRKIVDKVIIPFVEDLGARHLVGHPYLGAYDHEHKHLTWGLGHKTHGDKRHRTSVKFEAINYRDGEKIEGETRVAEIDHRIGWSRKLDNRKVANSVTVTEKIISFEETFNKLRSLSSLDIVNSFSASAQGEIAGIGGTVSNSQTISAHTELEIEKMNHVKKRADHRRQDRPRLPGAGSVRGGRAGRGRRDAPPGQHQVSGRNLAGRAPGPDAPDHDSDHTVRHLGLRPAASEHIRLGRQLRRPPLRQAQERAGR